MKRTKRTKRMICNHRCITEKDLDKERFGEISNVERKVIARKITGCDACKSLNKKYWKKHGG